MRFVHLLVALSLGAWDTADGTCANLCSGHGTCGAANKCTCFTNWMGADCSSRACRRHRLVRQASATNTAHAMMECSNRGTCDYIKGVCTCADGFAGDACQRSVCLNSCSGHGMCQSTAMMALAYGRDIGTGSGPTYTNWEANSMMACFCDYGYQGPDCSLRLCPQERRPAHDRPDVPECRAEHRRCRVGARGYRDVHVQRALCDDAGEWQRQLGCNLRGGDHQPYQRRECDMRARPYRRHNGRCVVYDFVHVVANDAGGKQRVYAQRKPGARSIQLQCARCHEQQHAVVQPCRRQHGQPRRIRVLLEPRHLQLCHGLCTCFMDYKAIDCHQPSNIPDNLDEHDGFLIEPTGPTYRGTALRIHTIKGSATDFQMIRIEAGAVTLFYMDGAGHTYWSAGNVRIQSGTLFSSTAARPVSASVQSAAVLGLVAGHASYASDVLQLQATRAGSSAFNLIAASTSGLSTAVFDVRGDGRTTVRLGGFEVLSGGATITDTTTSATTTTVRNTNAAFTGTVLSVLATTASAYPAADYFLLTCTATTAAPV
ncbi:hypothetical protein SPRG_22096 [Saprolegnia parasitica CBS 223.65]|uniref:EGF-like domain-containing protein n=1 Tax=Saprolegnia parasitica (strain CBS 223.65) TaxID=695850 RepID=A0A067CT78_SAPPC|nr:hypothetical protein SPRG_22096 [Saprolegnia parasitica CBS 223.65]KDO33683.1 hypothetical protein SPRG_22096 [Saprolegnia parasitica CBS 223.65]|eukprot:XP_012195774.1 hypothetical protein SPRG_22096 [Saprolegnia parasitica CBS 223.65]